MGRTVNIYAFYKWEDGKKCYYPPTGSPHESAWVIGEDEHEAIETIKSIYLVDVDEFKEEFTPEIMRYGCRIEEDNDEEYVVTKTAYPTLWERLKVKLKG